jgi:hypothetical protein
MSGFPKQTSPIASRTTVMKKLAKLAIGLGIGLGWVALIIYGVLAYLVTRHDEREIVADGLGRQLYDTPWLLRLIIHDNSKWPGWPWFIVDIFIYAGFLALTAFALKLRKKLD